MKAKKGGKGKNQGSKTAQKGETIRPAELGLVARLHSPGTPHTDDGTSKTIPKSSRKGSAKSKSMPADNNDDDDDSMYLMLASACMA